MDKFKTVVKIIFTLAIVGLIAFFGVTCARNMMGCNKPSGINPSAPSSADAPYKITVVVTGNIYYAKLVVSTRNTDGKTDTHVIKGGIWEIENNAYVFKDISVSLDERVFGEVRIERRQ